MPLSPKGKKVLGSFIHEYGKKKGKKFFYAWENKHQYSWLKEGYHGY